MAIVTLNFPVVEPVINLGHICLRQMTQADAPDFFAIRTNADVMKYIDRPIITTQQDAIEMIDRGNNLFLKKEMFALGIVLQKENKLIGTIGFYKMDSENYRAEIGYMLLPSFWRKGITTIALQAMIDYGFKEMNLHSIEANVNPQNEASKMLLKKFGFVKEAYFKENYYFNGNFLDSEIYSLVKKTTN